MVRQIIIAASTLAFLSCTAAAQGSPEKGAAVRKAFKACESAQWQGTVNVPLDKSKAEDNSDPKSIKMDCAAYLNWWDNQGGPSPFTILDSRSQTGHEIPANEWTKYLQFLPVINADTKPNAEG